MKDDDDRGVRILIPDSHIHRGRTQGCWNCRHWESGKDLWNGRRQDNLKIALELARSSPLGENDQRVYNIRTMVDTTDNAVASGALGHCSGNGENAHGQPVGELVMHNFLCHKWSAAEGASLAREFGKTDKLPEELAADLEVPHIDDIIAEKNRLEGGSK